MREHSVPLTFKDRSVFYLVLFLSLLFSGCGGGSSGPVIGSASVAGMAPVKLSFTVPAGVASLKGVTLLPGEGKELALARGNESLFAIGGSSLARFLIPNAQAAPPPAGVTLVVVTISGPGMATIVDRIPITPGVVVTRTYNVPVGPNRSFVIQAFNAAGALVSAGTRLIPLLRAGVPVVINLPMLPAVAADITAPVISLLGTNPVNVALGVPYIDAGATALDNIDGNITANILVTNPVNSAIAGVYTMTYNVSDAAGNAAVPVTRTVNVVAGPIVDVTPPVITLIGTNPVSVMLGSVYVDAGATATDNVDGNITASLAIVNNVNTAVVGVYTVTYNVSDAAGNAAAPVTRTVNVIVADAIPPVIKLLGRSPVNVTQGTVYVDAGATALDNVDGNITANIVTRGLPLSTAAVRTLLVIYNVSDAAGNAAAQVIRTVNVVAAGGGGGVLPPPPPPNQPPVPAAPVININGVSPGTSQISPNDPNPGNTHTYSVTTQPLKGTVTVSVAGLVTYTPSLFAFIGGQLANAGNLAQVLAPADTLSVTVTDNGGLFGVVTINVNFVPPPTAWRWVHPTPMGDYFHGVAHNGTTYVAVGEAGVIFSSTDGVNWTQRTSPVANRLREIGWGNGLFVAVGDSGTIVTSPDGISWTWQFSGTAAILDDVVWSGTKFMVVGKTGAIVTSPSGIIWTSTQASNVNTAVFTANLSGVTWNGALFIAVGSVPVAATTATILTSPTGNLNSWTAQVSGTVNSLDGIVWNGTTLVAVGGSGTILTSANAIAWTAATSTPIGVPWLEDVSWDSTLSQFIAVGGALSSTTPSTIWASSTGNTWAARTSPINNRASAVVNNGQAGAAHQLVVVGNEGIMTSPDGSAWTSQQSGLTTDKLDGIAWSGTRFVATGSVGTLLTSLDGVTWTSRTSPTVNWLEDVLWNGTQFIAVGGSGTILTSPAGINWAMQSSGTTNWLESVVWDGSQYVVVGWNGTILTSPGGINWTLQASGTTNNLRGIAWNGTKFAVVGTTGGTFLTSPGAVNWTVQTPITAISLHEVMWNGSLFVAVGSSGHIWTSADAASWIQRASGTIKSLDGIVWNGLYFVVTGSGGTILTSPDGINWATQASGTAWPLSGIGWSGSRFVALGSHGSILVSP